MPGFGFLQGQNIRQPISGLGLAVAGVAFAVILGFSMIFLLWADRDGLAAKKVAEEAKRQEEVRKVQEEGRKEEEAYRRQQEEWQRQTEEGWRHPQQEITEIQLGPKRVCAEYIRQPGSQQMIPSGALYTANTFSSCLGHAKELTKLPNCGSGLAPAEYVTVVLIDESKYLNSPIFPQIDTDTEFIYSGYCP